VRVVYLHGEKAVIAARLAERKGHFMPSSLLDSQFAVLEEPDPNEESIRLETDRLVGDIVAEIVHETQSTDRKSITCHPANQAEPEAGVCNRRRATKRSSYNVLEIRSSIGH